MYKYDAGNHYPCWDVLQQCSLDGHAGTADQKDPTATRENGVSTSSWWRALDTGDSKDSPIVEDGQMIMFARGVDDQFNYHTHEHYVKCTTNFFTGESDCAKSASDVSFV